MYRGDALGKHRGRTGLDGNVRWRNHRRRISEQGFIGVGQVRHEPRRWIYRYHSYCCGRVGVGNARLLVYGTGGGAWANIEQLFTTSNTVNTFLPFDDDDDDEDDDEEGGSESVWGYQAGGGIDVRLGAQWSLTGEYLFTSLQDREDSTIRVQGPAPATNPFILVNPAGTALQRTDKFEFHAVRAGLTYRF